MRTENQPSYKLEPVVVGRGLDEFASEDELTALIFEIEDATVAPPPAVTEFLTEVVAAPLPEAPPAVPPAAPVARRRAPMEAISLSWLVPAHPRRAVGALSVASLAFVLALPSSPPGDLAVGAVSTPAWPQTLGAADVPAASQIQFPVSQIQSPVSQIPAPAARRRPEPFPEPRSAAAPLKRPVVAAARRTAAPSAAPEPKKGKEIVDIPQPQVLGAHSALDIRTTNVAEPAPATVAVVTAVFEEATPVAPEPPAALPPVPVSAAGTVVADRSAIDDLLSAYRRSYNSLDAGAVSAIWRGADTRALARAFSSLSHQRLTFEQCDVRVTAPDRARARCDGILSYVQKAGDRTPQQRRVSWSMDLGRPDDKWVIVGVQAH